MKKLKSLILLAVVFTLVLSAVGLPVTAVAATAPEKITVKGSHEVAKGKKIALTATVKPEGASQDVTWTSSDKSVATVNKHGKVTGVKAGSAVITVASEKDPAIKKKWKITVYPKAVKKIKLSTFTTDIYLDARKTIQIAAKVSPEGATDTLEWTSSNTKVARVSEDGLVTARKPGVAKITAAAVDGSKVKTTIVVRVRKNEPALPETDPEQPVKYYALLIANSNYKYINKLASTKTDAAAMKGALSGMSQKWKITTRKDLTSGQISSAISTAFRDATANDICLFYYSGHGSEDMYYYPGALMGINYDGDADTADLFTAARLRKKLDAVCPGRVIVMLETCGSGAVIYDGEPLSWEISGNNFSKAAVSAFRNAGDVETRTGELLSNKYTVITTCEYGDWGTVFPVENDTDCGLLTYCTIKALGCRYPGGSYTGSMPGDTDGDGTLTLAELKAYANPLLEEIKADFNNATTQVFQYYGDNSMELFIR